MSSLLALAVVIGISTPAAAVTGTVNTSGAALTVRTAPHAKSAAIGSLADGATITIRCQTHGQSITGTYGTTTLWDYVPDKGGFVSDAYVYTGADGFVAPYCTDTSVTTQCTTGGACAGQAVFDQREHTLTVYDNKADGSSAVARYWLADGSGPHYVWNSNGSGSEVAKTIALPSQGWVFYQACIGEGGPKTVTAGTCSTGITGFA